MIVYNPLDMIMYESYITFFWTRRSYSLSMIIVPKERVCLKLIKSRNVIVYGYTKISSDRA